MSMSTWTVDGYGVSDDDLCPSVDAQIAFIKKFLPEVYEEMQSEGEDACDMSNTSECLDFCQDWINDYEDDQGNTGICVLFAEAINAFEDGFYVEYLRQDYGAVMYCQGMPWQMSERVKAMTEEDMAAVFKKYLKELGLENVQLGMQSVEFFG